MSNTSENNVNEEEEVYFVIKDTTELPKMARVGKGTEKFNKLKALLPYLHQGQHFDIPIKSGTEKEVRSWRAPIINLRKEESPVYDKVRTVIVRNADKVIIALRVFIPKYE